MCYSEILRSVAIHARMIFQRRAGLISLLGYNRQLVMIDSSFSQCLFPQSKDSGFVVFRKGCCQSKYHALSLDVYCSFCSLVPIVCKCGCTIHQKGLNSDLENK